MTIEQKEKIFFLHIPKAAGTSVNEMLAKHFANNRVKFHVEGDRENKFGNISINKLDMFSGHVNLCEVKKYIPVDNFLRVTVVRDPFQQLISHINWVKHISEEPNGSFFRNHPEQIKEFSLKLREVNFEDIAQVELFFHSLSAIGHNLFNNCQTRYLFDGQVAPIRTSDVVEKVIKTLDFFDVIGVVEKINEFMEEVYERMNWNSDIELIKINALNNKYNLDRDSQRLREVLNPLICADQILYDHIVRTR
jgi:hypothetical protein